MLQSYLQEARPFEPASRHELAVLYRAIASLWSARFEHPSSAESRHAVTDPVSRWASEHQEQLRSYAGRHIAIGAEGGVVADGASYGEVRRRCADLGLLGKVAIQYVRP